MLSQKEKSIRTVAAFIFGYESIAIVSGKRLPTISSLCSEHQWLTYIAISGLVYHLNPKIRLHHTTLSKEIQVTSG